MDSTIPGVIDNSDGTVTWSHPHGSVRYRRHASGTFYHAQTEPEVVALLERARVDGRSVRIFYGDARTGRDWLEESDVQGTLGRSTGPLKVPLLIAHGSAGGSALLDHCIVRLRIEGREAWRHRSYFQGEMELVDTRLATHPFGVDVDGQWQAQFKTDAARSRYLRSIGAEGQTSGAKGLVGARR